MNVWLIVFGLIYLSVLIGLALYSRRNNSSVDDFMLAGSNIGIVLGVMTFAATLFSTFTLMGMPDFFRNHGIAAWIFLAVADGVMVFLIVWFGYHLRRKVAEKGFRGMSGLLNACYEGKAAGYVYFFGVFVFLIPYVAIQVRGVSIFLVAIFPELLPSWAWASIIVGMMLSYSAVGGLKGIVYADFLQGTVLLITVWFIAFNCISYFGGVEAMFQEVESRNVALLSAPGPKGLFNLHFLISSFLAILLIPVTQPQLATRLVVLRSLAVTRRMAVAVGFFAILIILPTLVIGMYGAVRYPDMLTADFLAQALLFDQPAVIGAIALVGLIAAALSTSDSQIFALGAEFRSLQKGEQTRLIYTRLTIIGFGIAALIFSILSSDQLVMLARVSFAGTSLMAPMILLAILTPNKPGLEVVAATGVGLLIFIASLFGLIPSKIADFRIETVILLSLGIFCVASWAIRNQQDGVATTIENTADMEP